MKDQYLIWDWNGTLLDDVDVCICVMNQMLQHRGLRSISGVEEYRNLFCFPVKEYYQKLNFDFVKEPFEDLAHCYGMQYDQAVLTCELFDDVENTVEQLHQRGIKQLILSASQQESLIEQASRFEISQYMTDILGISDYYAVSKVQLAENFMQQKEIVPSQVLIVGDTAHDAEVAKAIGCDCILLSRGHQSQQLLKGTGAKIVSALSDVLEYI